ncbi:hypothetical protein JCM12825_16820 [Desulfurobacterium crinifex]
MTVGKIEKAKGRVSILKKGSFRGINYKRVKGKIEVGDIVRTKRKSFADISFIDKTRVHLEESSRLIVEKYIPGKEVTVSSPSGKVVYRVVKVTRGAYRIKTPTALIGVKGTELATIVDSGISVVVVKEGAVEVVNPELPQYRVVVKRNMATVVKPGKPPAKPVIVSKTVIEKVFKGAKPKKEETKSEEKQEKKPEKKSEEKQSAKKESPIQESPAQATTPSASSKEKPTELSREQSPAAAPSPQEQPITEVPPPAQEISSPVVTAPMPAEEVIPTEEVSIPEETVTVDTSSTEDYTEIVTQETTQEITQEEVTEEVITEAIANVKLENGIVKLNVAIPSTDTPK